MLSRWMRWTSIWSVPTGTALCFFSLLGAPLLAQAPAIVEPAGAPMFVQEAVADDGADYSYADFAPNMMGDAGGIQGSTAVAAAGTTVATLEHPSFGLDRTKISYNNSPMPRDRAYFAFQSLQRATSTSLVGFNTAGVPSSISAADLAANKYVLGVEKTFLDRRASFQIQMPILEQLTNHPTLNFDSPAQAPNQRGGVIGDVTMALKTRLWQGESLLLSGGGLLHIPTGPDVTVRAVSTNFANDIDHRLTYDNQAVVLSPFLGFLATPNERWFVQGFWEVDVDVSGNGVNFSPVVNGVAGTQQNFRIYDQTLMRADVGAGRWFYRNPDAGFITGVAGSLEVHWSGTLENATIVRIVEPGLGTTILAGNLANQINPVYLTLGPTVEMANRSTLAAGFVAPLTTGDNRNFDWEFDVQLNYRFGYRN